MQSRITLVPTGGLCNRMISIMNAIDVCKDHDISIDIKWWKNNELFADFEELFLPIKDNKITISKLTQFKHLPSLKRNFFLPTLLRQFVFDRQYSSSDQPHNLTIEQIIGNHTSIYISTFTRFSLCTPSRNIASVFRPTKEIEDNISQVTRQYNKHTIGIHIRRTDNVRSIKYDTIDKYYRLMDNEISTNEETMFYLASDDEKVKEDAAKRYGNRIITQSWELNRRSLQGMKDAVAELFCLGKCHHVIGSKYSTYSIYAARLYDKPFIAPNEE